MAVKRWYLTKCGGSQGLINDFSSAQVMEEKELFDSIWEGQDKDKAEIEPYPDDTRHFDKRIGFYTYMLVAPMKDGSCDEHKQYCKWIYSTSPEHPYLSELDYGY